jgi:soluble lytic murein transglycosylase-like protein
MKILFITVLLAGALALSGVGWQPAPPPIQPRSYTEADIKRVYAAEVKEKTIQKAAKIAARLYRAYGCPVSLARPTAENAIENGLPVRLVTSVIIVESSCRQRAVSKAGATGYMQVMPKLHHVSRQALMDRDTNLRVGTRILANLIHLYGRETGLASYFGISPGSDAAWDYSYRVMEVAGYTQQGGG